MSKRAHLAIAVAGFACLCTCARAHTSRDAAATQKTIAQYNAGKMPPGWLKSMRRIYGEIFPNLEGTEYDCFVKSDRIVANGGPYPVLYHYCGLEETDLLRHSNIMKDKFLGYEGNPFRYTLSTYHGVHNWDAWDAVICEALDYVGFKEVPRKLP